MGISAADIDQNFRKGWNGDQNEEDIKAVLDQVADQSKAEAQGAEQNLVGFVPDEPVDEMDQEKKAVGSIIVRQERNMNVLLIDFHSSVLII